MTFVWWSSYKAPSAQPDEMGHLTWHELHPGDTGIVIKTEEDQTIVLFSHIDTLIKVHESMLEAV